MKPSINQDIAFDCRPRTKILGILGISITDFLALLSGVLLVFAFAPFYFYPLATITPALLFYSCLNIIPKRAYWRGFLFGLGEFGVGISWIYISIHVYGNTAPLLAAFFTLGFVIILAQFTAGCTYLFIKLFPRDNTLKLFAFPLLWVVMEWLRAWILTGFPWLLLCYSQTNSPLRGYIPIMGDHGVTFLLTLTSSLFILCFLAYQRKRLLTSVFAGMAILIIWLGGYFSSGIHWNKPLGKPLQVSLIQGNIPQELKWNEAHIKPTLELYLKLTQQHWADSQLIIWPEAAITLPMPYAKNSVSYLDKQAKQHKVALIVGIPVRADNQFYFYNAILGLGNGSGAYYKRHLVPFGEYVPFEQGLRGFMTLFDLPMSSMVSGPTKQPPLIINPINNPIIIAPFVCYEIAYASDLYQSLPQANLLVTLSNDTWFGDSLAPPQHLQIGQYRAIQAARELLLSTNNGITAIVNSQGQLLKKIPQFETGVLTGMIQPMTGATPWSKIGDMPLIFLIISALVIIWIIDRLKTPLKTP